MKTSSIQKTAKIIPLFYWGNEPSKIEEESRDWAAHALRAWRDRKDLFTIKRRALGGYSIKVQGADTVAILATR
jgi:hypothetical protein